MKVLVTGINGFIGRYISDIFLLNGHDVTGFDLHTECTISNVKYIRGHMEDDDIVKELVSAGPFDYVVHLAANLAMNEPYAFFMNTKGTYNILKAAKDTGSAVFIHLSSIPVIGLPGDRAVTEETAVAPRTLYHVSKYASEHMVLLPEFDCMCRYNLRIASPVGPGMPRRFLSIMLALAMEGQPLTLAGKGARIQNYIDVRDIASAVLKVADSLPEDGLYLIGGESVSNLDAARICVRVAKSASDIVFSGDDDPSDNEKWIVDDSRARSSFGYRPEYSLAESLKDMLR